MAKADKATAVAEITEQFKTSTATVVTEYRGLTVANLAELRRSLSGHATYTVAKNTLVKRAAAEAGIEGLDDLFAGPTAIAFVSGEAVDAAKVIKKFAKDPLSVAEVERIADLESREVLLAKLAAFWEMRQPTPASKVPDRSNCSTTPARMSNLLPMWSCRWIQHPRDSSRR